MQDELKNQILRLFPGAEISGDRGILIKNGNSFVVTGEPGNITVTLNIAIDRVGRPTMQFTATGEVIDILFCKACEQYYKFNRSIERLISEADEDYFYIEMHKIAAITGGILTPIDYNFNKLVTARIKNEKVDLLFESICSGNQIRVSSKSPKFSEQYCSFEELLSILQRNFVVP